MKIHSTRRLRGAALTAALTAGFVVAGGSPATATTTVEAPAGAISGAVVIPGRELIIEATTAPGRYGFAQVPTPAGPVRVELDCVRTYGSLGVILFPIVGGIGYAAGTGSDGKRYYILVNEGYGWEVTTTPGAPVDFDTCGTGYVIPRWAPSPLAVVPESTKVSTLVGLP